MRIAQTKNTLGYVLLCLKTERQLAFQNVVPLKKVKMMNKVPKGECVS
jgi:hypothetical protein